MADNADEQPDGFITLPPGIIDSGTFKRSTPRVERPPKRVRDEVVFIPTVPGAPPTLPGVRPEPGSEPGPEPGADSAPRPEPEASAPQPVPEIDDATRVSVSRHAGPSWRLVLPDGAHTVVDGPIYLGRNPSSTPRHPQARLLSVIDPEKTVSKTHALLELDAGQLWVHDLDSTNGVFVAAPGADVVEVEPGSRAIVPPGSDLELGDFVIQVEHG